MRSSEENKRLEISYERLRERLLDMSLRNPMLNYKHRATSKKQLQLIDLVIESCYGNMTDGTSLEIVALPDQNQMPADELSEEFVSALEHAKVSDVDYLARLAELEGSGRADEYELGKIERLLRDRVRANLGLRPRPNLKSIDPTEHARSLGIDPSFELFRRTGSAASTRKLQTLKWTTNLDSLLARISDDARIAEEETGLSTLFLVFGFLEWRESADSDKPLLAPLLLLPVKLEKRKVKGKSAYFLTATADSAETNLSLQKKMMKEFDCQIPDFETDEGSSGSVERYLTEVETAIAGRRGWLIRRMSTLGLFSFGRFAMYADLDPVNWPKHPINTKLVGSVVEGTDSTESGDGEGYLSPPDYPIDNPEIEKLAPFLIHDADASQHSALVDVMSSKNLVIQGPPGTGKSQTITNIIANALAAGKTVLFLAEKQAALEVVKRRLDTAELGDFCLELHSDKASPKNIIDSLKRRVSVGLGKPTSKYPVTSDAVWTESRSELKSYTRALHTELDDIGETPFQLIWKSVRSRAEIGALLQRFRSVLIPQMVVRYSTEFDTAQAELELFGEIIQNFEAAHCRLRESPWNSVRFGKPKPSSAFQIRQLVQELHVHCQALSDVLRDLDDLGIEDLTELDSLVALNETLTHDVPDGDRIDRIKDLNAAQIDSALHLRTNLEGLSRSCDPYPKLADVPEATIKLAAKIAQAMGDSPFVSLPPSAAYRELELRIQNAENVASHLRSLIPALEIFGGVGVGKRLPLSGLTALSAVISVSGELTEDTRRWFLWKPSESSGGTIAFRAAHERWQTLVNDEARWRKRFPAIENGQWPDWKDVTKAATIAAKHPVARIFISVGGGTRALTEVSLKLAGSHGAKLPPGELHELAQHIQAVTEFVSNNITCEAMLGLDWRGLETPFPEIATGLALRTGLNATVSKHAHAAAILDDVDRLDIERLAKLAPGKDELLAIATLEQELNVSLDQTTVETKLVQTDRLLERFRAWLSIDKQRILSQFECSILELSQRLGDQERLRNTLSALAVHPLAWIIGEIAGSPRDIDETRRASEWIQHLNKKQVTATLKKALLSNSAASVRRRMASASEAATPQIRAMRKICGEIQGDYAVHGLGHNSLKTLLPLVDSLISTSHHLGDFLALREQEQRLEAIGLKPFIDLAQTSDVAAEELPTLFKATVVHKRAEEARQKDPVLSKISGLRIEARRKEFVDRDKQKILADRKRIKERLLTAVPAVGKRQGSRKTWTDMELIYLEFNKQNRFYRVRDLVTRAGTAIRALKPCFMMSPLSLAKFLPSGRVHFDILVIDEASQMRPEDALGGLLRASQLVVVGDQKQLPPTNFFHGDDGTAAISNDGDGDGDGDGGDNIDDESILEACQKTFRQTRMLRWHYRSRCESLISFSNREFYNNQLITFPMAKPGSFSIDLVRINGAFQSGRNLAEAQVIAEEAIKFMRHFGERDDGETPSMGIVAANSEQSELIFEEIRRLSADDELVDGYHAKVAKKGEKMFVKNLEKVQGDERDYIFISMTYGKRPGETVVRQTFGPIVSKHGHRRLNVLFSRARLRIALFTSFGSADVRPTETSSAGVRALKSYLAYVEQGGRGMSESSGGEPDSDFEVDVARRLQAHGFQVDCQVGVSGFRLDLGVKHPDHPERYIAGIECDGATYHSSKSARDRDRLREEVLRGLGWNIIRVWSTDWFDNPDQQTERLLKRLEEIRSSPAVTGTDYGISGGLKWDTAGNDSPQDTEATNQESSDAVPDGTTNESMVDTTADIRDSSFLNRDGPLKPTELHLALREFRDTVIAVEMQPWEPQRSILREGMIETFIQQELDDPQDWFKKVPQFQRQGTNPIEKNRYLNKICEVVGRT